MQRILDEFAAHFRVPRHCAHATACAAALTDEMGRGKVSLLQLRAFLAKHAEDSRTRGEAPEPLYDSRVGRE